ncbi:hypothetical protein POX_a00458 [Penicillium oxalicum]|nr:hypothetical protein POX_a00458 [Penicillium oxalicum]KAI2793870.1 hypothetical protein POX_a00458 [Penicillium oxalicum]
MVRLQAPVAQSTIGGLNPDAKYFGDQPIPGEGR